MSDAPPVFTDPPIYTVNRIKPLSNSRRYEYLRELGVSVFQDGRMVLLHKEELDRYIDRAVWEEAHPGVEPICVF